MSTDDDLPTDPSQRQLTDEEEKEIRAMFSSVDKNEDGEIDMTEFGNAWRGLGGNPSTEEIETALREMDKNGDNIITFEEFRQFYVRNPRKPQEEYQQELQDAFAYFDKDGDGFIKPEEIKAVLCRGRDGLSEEEIDEMFTMVDFDGDGKLNIKEFADSFFGGCVL